MCSVAVVLTLDRHVRLSGGHRVCGSAPAYLLRRALRPPGPPRTSRSDGVDALHVTMPPPSYALPIGGRVPVSRTQSRTSKGRIRLILLRIRLVDLVVILVAVLIAELIRFGTVTSITGEARADVGFS